LKHSQGIIRLCDIRDESVGGKARGLKLLLDLGLPVPDGFVLILPDPETLDEKLLQQYLFLLGDGPKAIRSSAISEDSQTASFAGQFETILNVSGIDAVRQAINTCVGTAGAERVRNYSRNRIPQSDSRISVLVQNMVPASISGVLFTADPVTHRRDMCVINAVKGTGDVLVSGKTDAHHYEVFRSGSNLHLAAQSNWQLLPVTLLQELLAGALKTEEAAGIPVDMEWAVDASGKLFWLQARPVTTLQEVHYNELDTVKGPSNAIWTLGNIGEMMPGVTTPLTYSVVVDAIDFGMCMLAAKGGAFRMKERDGYHYIQMFYNRLFINLTHMMEYASRIWLNKPENIQQALSVPVNMNIRETWKAPLWLRIFNFGRQAVTIIRAGTYLRKCHQLADRFRVNINLPCGELYLELGRKRKEVCVGFGHHLITSGQSGTLYSAFMGILTDDKRLPDAADHHIATILLSGIPNIESADAVKSLESFSRLIRASDDFAAKFIQVPPAEALDLIRYQSPQEIAQLYQEFLFRHGHRCVRESELREKPWEENQERLIRLLQMKIRTGDSVHRESDLQEEMRTVLKRLPVHKRFAFRILLPTARKAVARREISKALTIRMVNELRKGYRILAEKMIRHSPPGIPSQENTGGPGSLLDDTDQIYFFTHDEIGELLRTGDLELLRKANRRRELLAETDKFRFPDVCFGIPEPACESIPYKPSDDQLQGTPVSSGKITGRIRIVTCLDEADLLEKGEIMVASFTDIGWTPYFSIISGLITEIGSPLSHGAVVAREYGIPAVVGVKGAMSWLRNGEWIVLDGDRGLVTKDFPSEIQRPGKPHG
jgi:pyruvate,water dikinase